MHLPTSPVYCSHFTLGNPEKSFFNSIIHTYIRLFVRPISEENKLLPPYPPHLKNVTALPCKMQKLFICCIPPNAGGSDKSRLWCVATASNVTESIQTDHLLHGYMLPVFFATISCIVHHALLKFSPCRNKRLPQLAVAACPRRSYLPGWGQDCWLATCQDWWTGVSRGAEAWLCHRPRNDL